MCLKSPTGVVGLVSKEFVMRSSNLRYIGLTVTLLFVALNSGAQKVTTTIDNHFDFKNAKRYAWGQNHIITRQGHTNDALIDQKIIENVNRALAARGFIEDRHNPDFFVFYEAGGSNASAEFEGPYSPPVPASTAAVQPVYGISQNVWYSVDGHITFRMIDASSNKPIWTSLATKKIRDPHKAMKDMPKQVEQIVSKTFKKFPPNTE
jgi:Domain of unknown function (DUF4136)